ncbi:polysaccharide deacetylase family protein [Nonomuraea sediminis]|uniref:polysaccharide deacetylase family protein n=1 Tax=Nonomuraea sediminis TaxID=2835864 RepID=UPI001BDD4B3C|nr:polysaccharide deacetylase family protein [Nonomuraea sediminis]
MTAWVLMYHSVGDVSDDPYRITVSPRRFTVQLAWLARRGLRGVSVRELRAARAAGRARGLVGLTFDDGYADFVTQALPVLMRHGFTATVFVVADRVGMSNAWDPEGPRKALMTAAELRWVVGQGMEVGSHTMTHLSLTGAPSDQVDVELKASRVALEELLDREVTGFAYPYGHVDEQAMELVRRAGYGYACAIAPPRADAYAMPRTYIGRQDGRLRLRAKHARHLWAWGRGR